MRVYPAATSFKPDAADMPSAPNYLVHGTPTSR
jgi:hypothetical protein